MLIVPGPASTELGRKVSEITGLRLVEVESKIFPDGDTYLRFTENLRDEDVALVQSTSPPQDRHLMQLFLMLDGLRDLGCRDLHAIVPYLAYMRQDKRFLEGETISAGTVLSLIKSLRVSHLITVDVHNKGILEAFHPLAIDLTAMPLIADWIRSQGWITPLIVAPDEGARERAKIVSEALSTDLAVGIKTRDRKTGKISSRFDADFRLDGRVAVIVDEAITRGDTVVKAAEILLERGAERVAAACTHGLFSDGAIQRIRDAGVKELVSTDTVPSSESKISVAPVIAEALQPITSRGLPAK